MRAKLMFILALIVSLSMTLSAPGEGTALALQYGGQQAQPIWGQATDTFYLELRLDQVREQLLVEVGLAPSHALIFIEVQTSVLNPDGSLTTSVNYHAMGIDANGFATTSVDLASNPRVTDYRITGYAVLPDSTVEATESWALLSRPVATEGDIEAIFPGLQRDLEEEMTASFVEPNDFSAIGLRYNWDGMSQSFVPSGLHNSLEFSISGPGTVFTSLPMNSMRLSSGPAGVFTAN